MECFSPILRRVYVSKKGIVHLVEEQELLYNPDGSLRDKRPRKKEPQNINTDIPLKWTGKFIKKKEAVQKFIFTNKKQLVHVNGLTFDFLFDMAKTLDKKDSLLLIRGGEKGDQPVDDESRRQSIQRLSRGPRKRRFVLPDTASFEYGTETAKGG